MPTLSPKQISYIAKSNHSFNIAEGAVSSGKTFAQILRWYKHIYDAPDGCLLMMSGKTGESLYDNVIRDLIKLDAYNDFVYSTHPQRVVVKSKGIEIACSDAHDEKSWGRIQGKSVAGWLGDEITRHPRSFVDMAIPRCRWEGRIWPKFWTCNPEFPDHYVKKDFIENEKLDIRTWHFVLDDNPVLSSEYITELKSAYRGVFYDRYILGKWVMAEGSVYEEFDREVHVVEKDIGEGWRRIRGIDFGFTNAFVCLFGALDEDNRLHIYDEHYRPKMLIKDHAATIRRREGSFSFTVADHDSQDAAELLSHGVGTRPAQKDVVRGIQKVKARLLVQADGRPRLTMSPKCKNLIREFGSYRWAEPKEDRNEKEEPLGIDNHAVDALRYMVMELDNARTYVYA